ncbi:hypothetical protein SAMN05421749_101575 [Acinetobacter marinus]|uniref:Lipoprotein n=1 Tax=Acinetobacter marinus TaxID=281375 RepID=A0A1G6GYR0_9GAMM|nr:hypothetical protein [Acinetobacter marinus]SDB87139.1 hypothetical protein SAMN05421749_101575 [Acinetobacter marinus]
MKKIRILQTVGLLSLIPLLTACLTNQILSHKADGQCLITQQDMVLGKTTFKSYGTAYMLNTLNVVQAPATIGYREIGSIPTSTRLSIYRMYETWQSTGYIGAHIVVRIEEGSHQGVIATLPLESERIGDPNTGKRTIDERGNSSKPYWYRHDETYEVKGKVFKRADVTQIIYNEDFLKKCD